MPDIHLGEGEYKASDVSAAPSLPDIALDEGGSGAGVTAAPAPKPLPQYRSAAEDGFGSPFDVAPVPSDSFASGRLYCPTQYTWLSPVPH